MRKAPILSTLLALFLPCNNLPSFAQENSTASKQDAVEIKLKETIKPRFGAQAQTQSAGTPNQAGLGGFLPLLVKSNSVIFLDSLANINFADFNGYSSISGTEVDSATISTSTRVGVRWFDRSQSWMYGINAGYDTRPLATGDNNDLGIPLFGTSKTAFFQQAAVNAEIQNSRWKMNAYALIPTGQTEQAINWAFEAGALNTYGFDTSYLISNGLTAKLGYYYQDGDLGVANGNGLGIGIKKMLQKDLSAEVNYSFDDAFKSRWSATITWRPVVSKKKSKGKPHNESLISFMTASPEHRDIRVHDPVVTSTALTAALSKVGSSLATFALGMGIGRKGQQRAEEEAREKQQRQEAQEKALADRTQRWVELCNENKFDRGWRDKCRNLDQHWYPNEVRPWWAKQGS